MQTSMLFVFFDYTTKSLSLFSKISQNIEHSKVRVVLVVSFYSNVKNLWRKGAGHTNVTL